MAENKTPTPKPSSLSDTHSRDQFIAVALKEIIKDQIANKKWNHDQAAVLAVRYANAVMVARGDTEPLKVVVSKGSVVPQLPLPPTSQGIVTDDDGNVVGEKSKTISEIIGDAEPVGELK